ncbi:MAG TPA: hypothetical protein VMF89_06555 [Polyangiales bacterium]|nr:hypothetical protein [Polyangiales bacterium]
MKKLLSGLVLLNALVFGAPLAHADAGDHGPDNLLTKTEFAERARKAEALAERVKRVNAYQTQVKKLQFNSGEWERRGPAVQIPELDANAAGAALALLIGGGLVLVDRKKRQATAV